MELVDDCSVYYSKAQNLRLALIRNMDEALREVDVLATPTTPMKAIELTGAATKDGSWRGRGAIDMSRNTCPSNLTGHPALSVPCGFGRNGLPIGLQLMGRRWDESTLFRTAYTCAGEREFGVAPIGG